MTEQAAATAPPVVPAVAQETTVPAQAQVAAPVDSEPTTDPGWLANRLDRAKASASANTLKDLGADSIDSVKTQLAELADLKASQLSEQERVSVERDALKVKADRSDALEKSITAYADRELAGLTEAQSTAVKAIAGADAARILSTIDSLRPAWGAVVPVVPTAPAAKQAAPVPVPATPATTAQPAGPPSAGTTSPQDISAEFKRQQTANPFAAAALLQRYGAEICVPNK